MRFGNLIVRRPAPDIIKPSGRIYPSWYCDCDCGTKDYVTTTEKLRSGKYKSCGCLNKKTRFQKMPNIYDLSGEYGVGYTLKEEEFYFDLEDYDKIKKYTWSINDDGYVITNSSGNDYYLLHRLITDVKNDFDVDHINHNKNDNRKKNLRLTTTQQNCSNRKITNKYGINGISKLNDKWVASIGVNNQRIVLGYFNTKEEAILSREQAEEKYYGEYSFRHSMKIAEENTLCKI